RPGRERAPGAGAGCPGLRLVGTSRSRGQPRELHLDRGARTGGRRGGPGGRHAKGRAVKRPESITVFTRRNPAETAAALRRVIEMGLEAGVEVRIPEAEAEKHGLERSDGIVYGADLAEPTDLAIALGGDGTILASLRLYAGRGVPTFAFNFGATGFLATLEHADLD